MEVSSDYNATVVSKLIVGFVVPIYVLLILLPSIFVNGLVVLTFCRVKDLRTPLNLLTVHISVIGILTTIFYSSVAVPTFATSMLHCSCELSYYKWNLAHVFHFSIYPLNILALAACYFFILKFSSKAITFKLVFIILVVIWFISIAINIPAVITVPYNQFVTCCQEVCFNQSSFCDTSTPLNKSFAPNSFSTESVIYFRFRDTLMVIVPSFFVIVFSSATYIVFWKSIINATIELHRRMLLLPILMTVSCGILFVAQNNINWQYAPPLSDQVPGIFNYLISNLSWDVIVLFFAVLVFYLNVRIRDESLKLLRCKKKTQTLNNHKTVNNSLSQSSVNNTV